MGIKSDILEGLDSALVDELSDVVFTIDFVEYTNVYNESTMVNVKTKTVTKIPAIRLYDTEKALLDDVTTRDYLGYLISDTDRKGFVFKENMVIEDDGNIYKIVTIKPDPSGATWKIRARKAT